MVDRHVVMSPRADDVEVLQLGGGRQDDVRVPRGVGQEMLQHDGEQVVPGQPAAHPRRVGLHHRRIGGPDHQPVDPGREAGAGERLAQPRQVQPSRRAGHEVGARGARLVQHRTGLEEEAAARVAPVAAQDGERGERAHEGLALDGLLGRDAGADGRRPGLRERPRGCGHVVGLEAADRGHPLRGPRAHLLAEGVQVQRRVRRERQIGRALLQHHPRDPGREEAVGPRPDGQVAVAALGGAGPARIDAHQRRAVTAPRLLDEVPVVVAGDERVRAPHQDQPAVRDQLGVEPARVSLVGHDVAGRPADAAIGAAGAQGVEDPEQRAALDHAHRAEIVERQQRLGAVLGDDAGEPVGDGVERLVPGDPGERIAALGPGPPERVEQAVGRVGAGGVVVDLGAQRAAGERMVSRALDPDDPVVLHVGHPGAGILAVERAAAFDEAGGHRGALHRMG